MGKNNLSAYLPRARPASTWRCWPGGGGFCGSGQIPLREVMNSYHRCWTNRRTTGGREKVWSWQGRQLHRIQQQPEEDIWCVVHAEADENRHRKRRRNRWIACPRCACYEWAGTSLDQSFARGFREDSLRAPASEMGWLKPPARKKIRQKPGDSSIV